MWQDKPRMTFITWMVLISLLTVGCGAGNRISTESESQGTADLVVRNGAIYTVDEAKTWAEAVAVKDERIVFVGSNQDVTSYITDQTAIIDLDGKMVLPGFHEYSLCSV